MVINYISNIINLNRITTREIPWPWAFNFMLFYLESCLRVMKAAMWPTCSFKT